MAQLGFPFAGWSGSSWAWAYFAPQSQIDGFTLDEAYHIAAGVFYVKHGDFAEKSIPRMTPPLAVAESNASQNSRAHATVATS